MRIIKTLSLIFALANVVFAAAWTGSTSEPENMKKIDGKPYYVITTADELAWFAAQVNGGKTTINAVLNNDIVFGKDKNTVSTVNWTPIGKDASHLFAGVFDGANYAIYGMSNTSANEASLFGFTNTTAVVKNVKMNNFSFKAVVHSAGVVAVNKGLIQDSRNEGTLASSKDSSLAGGCAARNEGKIIGCISKTRISSVAYAGGVVGYNAGSVENSGAYNSSISGYTYAGGIAGFNSGTLTKVESNSNASNPSDNSKTIKKESRTVRSDEHHSKVYVSRLSYAGGITGFNEGMVNIANNTLSVKELSSRPMFIRTPTNQQYYSYYYSSYFYYGGISAYNQGTILNVVNNMTSSVANSGGIVGINSGSSAIVKNAVNYASSMSGLVWQNENGAKVINSYYDNTINAAGAFNKQNASAENAIGKTTADMKKDQFAWILNTANGTEKNSGVWSRADGYPIFAVGSNNSIRKVIFDDDGTTINRYTNYKGLVTFPEDPEPAEGYIFSGWFNANNIKVKSTTVFTEDQTVKAIYSDASDVFWTINFYNAAPADTILESKSYQHGSVVTYGGVAPTKASTAQYTYKFKGWDVEPTNAVEDFDYHAVYDSTIRSYTIAFNNSDGSKIESATFEYGKMPSCSKTPTRTATVEWKYTHKGWKPALDYVTEETSYTAIYDSVKVEYKVTFMNGVDVIDEQMVPYGDAAVAPTNVTREGYKFVGWNTSFAKVTDNLTVKALFEELIIRTVNVVNSDGEKIVDQKVEDGGKYKLPDAPKKDGYSFDAYYDGDKKIGAAGDEIVVSGNVTIIAKYIKNPESSSSVVKSSSSSAVVSSSSVIKSSSSSKPASSSSAKSSSSTKVSSSSSAKVSSSSKAKSSSSSVKSSSSKKSDALIVTAVPKFSVVVLGRNLQIANAKVGASYALFDMQGKVLMQDRVASANFNVAVSRSGNYLLKISNRTQRVTVR